jgi:hypothetical protein
MGSEYVKHKCKGNRQFERKRCTKPPDKCNEIFEKKPHAKVSEGREKEGVKRVTKKQRKKKIKIQKRASPRKNYKKVNGGECNTFHRERNRWWQLADLPSLSKFPSFLYSEF